MFYRHSDGWLICFELYNRDGVKVLSWNEAAKGSSRKKEFYLEEGERIVGIVSRKVNDDVAIHVDLQFVIGRLI